MGLFLYENLGFCDLDISAGMLDPDAEIEFDFSPFLLLYKSGRVHRLIGTDFVPAATDSVLLVSSKDVIIDPVTALSARLYLPDAAAAEKKLPIVLYFHGGGFAAESAFSPTYHRFLNFLVAKARVLAVSVEYRLAPEHPLPAAYDDAFAALQWVASHAGGCGPEAWLADHGDFQRVFLAVDSAGGNISHNVAMRTGREPPANGVKVEGVVLLHPYFWGKEPVGVETRDTAVRRGLNAAWAFICAGRFGVEDPAVDPMGAGVLGGLPCRKVVVTVGGKDFFRERGMAYYEKLRESGWGGEAELVESEGEEHVFFLSKVDCEKALVEMEHLVTFFNGSH